MHYLKSFTALTTFFIATACANTITIFDSAKIKLAQLEKKLHCKIGVYALDTNSSHVIHYRGDELFPMQSTFKLIAVAALLKASENRLLSLDQKIYYTQNSLVSWSPITKLHRNCSPFLTFFLPRTFRFGDKNGENLFEKAQFMSINEHFDKRFSPFLAQIWTFPATERVVTLHLKHGMTLTALAEAAVSYSDNTAIDLIIKKLGGVKAINHFAYSIGNNSFNLQHYEAYLNSNPKNVADSATPKAMAVSLQKILLSDLLSKSHRQLLLQWMRNNTTAYKAIRAAVPIGWAVADKTGSGKFAVKNDLGIIWSPGCKPIIVSIYSVAAQRESAPSENIIAKVTQIILNDYLKTDCHFS